MSERTPHISFGQCGSAGIEIVKLRGADYYVRSDVKQCKDCARLKNVRRSCLRCNKPFQPGCRMPWHCAKCQASKASQ